MKQLGLLIVCLLVSFKSISQTATKDSVVVLTEEQARQVVADLVRYDVCKAVSKVKDERIDNFLKKEIEFKKQLKVKDSIISYKDAYIKLQDEILTKTSRIKFGGAVGLISNKFELGLPMLYGAVTASLHNFRLGAMYNVRQYSPPNYGIVFEYKLF
jgi:hypothetical protein